jgi:hypothetical protein
MKRRDRLDTFAPGHDEIGDDKIRRRNAKKSRALVTVSRLKHRVARTNECGGDHIAKQSVIVDKEKACHR